MITPFHDDPYMLVRQAYTPVATDTESEPLEDPVETKEIQPLSPRTTPLSPNYIPSSSDYTSDTPYSDEESVPIEAFETNTASSSDFTSPLSPNHPLTWTSPTPIPYRAFYYRNVQIFLRYPFFITITGIISNPSYTEEAYTPVATDTESEPLEDPVETKEIQPLSSRTTPLSPNYIPSSPDYTSDTPYSDEESVPIEAFETNTASSSDFTSPLSPNHPLTWTSPTPIPSRAFYYRSTA
nr:hypothetical protein [Tanacetum cinerariifolium]